MQCAIDIRVSCRTLVSAATVPRFPLGHLCACRAPFPLTTRRGDRLNWFQRRQLARHQRELERVHQSAWIPPKTSTLPTTTNGCGRKVWNGLWFKESMSGRTQITCQIDAELEEDFDVPCARCRLNSKVLKPRLQPLRSPQLDQKG